MKIGPAVVSLLIALVPASAAPPRDAKAMVDDIYRRLPRTDFDFHKVRYAPPLKHLIERDVADAKGEVGLIDAVPFCDCQDTAEDYAFTSSRRRVAPGRAEVTVHLRNQERSTYRLDMVRLPAGWAVADVHGPLHASLAGWLRANLR
jgi:hypothetical protein